MLVILAPLRLWIPLARSFSRVSISPFSAPPPASSSPRHKLVFLSLPPIPVSFFSLLPPSGLLLQPSFLFTPSLSPQTSLPSSSSSSSFYSVFSLPLLTAGSACVNICAALAHLFVRLVMRSEVCVTDPLHAGVSRGQTSLSFAVNKNQTEISCLLSSWETLNLEFTAEFKSVLSLRNT